MKKYLAGVVLSGLLLLPVAPAYASSLTGAQVEAIVNLLQAFEVNTATIEDVRKILLGNPTCIPLPVDLQYGSTDTGASTYVAALQRYLSVQPGTYVATSIYPEGKITGYFGPATERAVQRWQQKNMGMLNTDSAYGKVEAKTRAAMALCVNYY